MLFYTVTFLEIKMMQVAIIYLYSYIPWNKDDTHMLLIYIYGHIPGDQDDTHSYYIYINITYMLSLFEIFLLNLRCCLLTQR